MNAPLATATELACNKCKRFGCQCETPRLRLVVDVCCVCRRALPSVRDGGKCICESQAQYTERSEDRLGFVEGAVNEAMRLYLDRHPRGLAEHVRALAERVK